MGSKRNRPNGTQRGLIRVEAKRRAIQWMYGSFYSSGDFYRPANGIAHPESYRVVGEIHDSIVQAEESQCQVAKENERGWK